MASSNIDWICGQCTHKNEGSSDPGPCHFCQTPHPKRKAVVVSVPTPRPSSAKSVCTVRQPLRSSGYVIDLSTSPAKPVCNGQPARSSGSVIDLWSAPDGALASASVSPAKPVFGLSSGGIVIDMGFVARVAELKRDVAHWSKMYEDVHAKYEALKERIEVREGSEEKFEAEREAFDPEMREMEAELAKVREAYAADLKRLTDEKASGTHDQDLERCDAAEAELASARTQVEEANRRNERLEAENGAARDGLMRRISDLERVEADLTSLLRAEERDKPSWRTAYRISRRSLCSVTKALDNAKREMEGMQSPRSRGALEREYYLSDDNLSLFSSTDDNLG